MTGPRDHPLRYALTDEFHARPFAELVAPEQVSHFALLSPAGDAGAERGHLLELCARYGVAEPAADATHFFEDFGNFRLKWERHSEFTTYSFFHHGSFAAPFEEPACSHVPQDWLAGLPGERLVAAHLALGRFGEGDPALAGQFVTDSLCRGLMRDGRAEVWTDFRIHQDGFTRILVCDRGLAPGEAGRLVQRLLEKQTYRNMALLALPLARQMSPVVTRIDQSLAALTSAMKTSGSTGGRAGSAR